MVRRPVTFHRSPPDGSIVVDANVMSGNVALSRTSGPSIRVWTSARLSAAMFGSSTVRLADLTLISTEREPSAEIDPAAIGARMTWSSANAEKSPDLYTRTVSTELPVSIGRDSAPSVAPARTVDSTAATANRTLTTPSGYRQQRFLIS